MFLIGLCYQRLSTNSLYQRNNKAIMRINYKMLITFYIIIGK